MEVPHYSMKSSSSPTMGLLVLRVTLGGVMWPHGAQKVLGWFGGLGPVGTYDYFTQHLEIWGPWAIAAIVTEFVAPLMIIGGFFTRWAAFALIIEMMVAMKFNWANGFFMNWFGNQKGEGIEYQLLYIGCSMALLIMGAGKFSVDGLWKNRWNSLLHSKSAKEE